MNSKRFEFVFKFSIVLSILFILFSFISPIGTLNVENSDRNANLVDYYNWGFKINLFSEEVPEDISTVNPYFLLAFDGTFIEIFGESDNMFFIAMLVILLPIVVFSLIFAALGLYNLINDGVGYEKIGLLFSGICSLIAVVLFYLFTEFGMPGTIVESSYFGLGSITNLNFYMGLGSYLLIFSAFLVFSVFTISTYFFPLDNDEEEFLSDQILLSKLKKRYVNGEINKEEFEQIKKDIQEKE